MHVGHEVQDLVGVAPLVVVPGDELDEVVVQHDAGGLVKDAGLGEAGEVGGDHLVGGVGDDALHAVAGGVLHGDADIVIAGGLTEPGGEVHHGDVVGGDAEAHAGHLALQLRDDQAHGLGGAGGGGDDVAHDAAARAPVTAGAGVHGLLLGGGGVDGAHQGLLDAEGIVDDLGHGGQAVGGAGGVGDHVHLGGVVLVVHTHDEGGGHVVLRGGGDDDLPGTVFQVGRGGLRGDVGAGGLDDVLGPAVIPGDVGGVGAAVDPDLLTVNDEVAAVVLHVAGEGAEDGVVLHLIDHVVQVRVAQVDAADLIGVGAPLHHAAQGHAPDAAETVDAHFDRHKHSPLLIHWGLSPVFPSVSV